MRILLIVAVILLLGLGGWWAWQDKQPTQDPMNAGIPLAVDDTSDAAKATEAAADAAADAAAVAADVAAQAVEASQNAGIAPASDAAAEAEAAAEAALNAADRAAAAAAGGPSAPMAQAAEQAARAANEAAAATDQAATAAAAATRIQALLTPEGFNAAEVNRIIDNAAIDESRKATLRRLIETAGGNSDLLRQALDQVKAVMP